MAEIVSLRKSDEFGELPSLQDVPGMLERLAARIRAGDCGDVVRCALVLRSSDRDPAVFGWGDTDATRTFEDLHLGAAWLLAAIER